MHNGFTFNDSDQTRTPLIVVTEALPSEETAQDSTVKPIFFFKYFFNQKN
jgi:hypothetical protein